MSLSLVQSYSLARALQICDAAAPRRVRAARRVQLQMLGSLAWLVSRARACSLEGRWSALWLLDEN